MATQFAFCEVGAAIVYIKEYSLLKVIQSNLFKIWWEKHVFSYYQQET